MSGGLETDPLSLFRLDGKVAIVTGASSGLGERFARVLHAAGASVVVTARRRDRLERLAAALPGALAVVADVSDPDDRERIVATTVDQLGGVGILVNNAGVTEVVAVEDESLETFRRSMEINRSGQPGVHQGQLADRPDG